MKEITELRKQISEYDFKIRSLEEALKGDLKVLQENAETWHKMGVLNEEQKEFIMKLDVEDVKEGNLTSFIEMYKELDTIIEGLDGNIATLEEQISKIDSM